MIYRHLRIHVPCLVVLLAHVNMIAAAEPSRPAPKVDWNRDVRTAWQESLQTDRPLLVFVTMDSCLYCEKMKKSTLQDRLVLSDLQTHFTPVALNVKHAPELVQQLMIKSFPSTVVIQANGDVVESIAGYQTPQQLRQRLRLTLQQVAQQPSSRQR